MIAVLNGRKRVEDEQTWRTKSGEICGNNDLIIGIKQNVRNIQAVETITNKSISKISVAK